MEKLVRIAAVASTVLAFFGYAFLSGYYERFGIRLQDVPLDTSHIFLRLINLFVLKPVVLIYLTAIGALALSCFMPAKLAIGKLRCDIWMLAAPFMIALTATSYFHTRSLAIELANRDINPSTSALRQLVCANTGTAWIDSWINVQIDADRKILVLLNARDRIVVFLAPKRQNLPSPVVTVIDLGVGDDAMLAHTVSTVDILPDVRRATCTG